MQPEEIARICWEANRALQIADGEEWPDEPWDAAPEWRKSICIRAIELVREGTFISPEDTHDLWIIRMQKAGWTWGHEKDSVRKTNPSLIAWEELTPRAQLGQRLLVLITQQVMLAESNTAV